MRNSTAQPDISALLTESESTKRLWNQWHKLELRDGTLYRRYDNQPPRTTFFQILVPRALRDAAIHSCHAGMTGGHTGIKKTLDQVRRRFYWIQWRSDTERYCRRCPECCAYHRGQLPRTAPLQPIIAGAPFERLSIDLTGPHARSRRGHIYILTCIDPFTKWVEAFPLRNKEAETVARTLVDQVFCRFGVPIALLSDQGKEVDGNIMREICRLLDIDKLRTTPYKPSTNSAIERFHRSMNSMLGKVVKDSQTDWDERLPYVLAAYRASRHDSTGYSPNALTLGREVRAPVDVMLDLPTAEEAPATYDGYVEQLQDKMRDAYTAVRRELGRAAERNKRYYDLRVRPKRYSVGDWVYYYNPRHYQGRQDKWSRKYSGPHLIIAVPTAVNVTIQRHRRARPFTVHIDKVKPYLGGTPTPWITVAPAEVEVPPDNDNTDAPNQASPVESLSPPAAPRTTNTASDGLSRGDCEAQSEPEVEMELDYSPHSSPRVTARAPSPVFTPRQPLSPIPEEPDTDEEAPEVDDDRTSRKHVDTDSDSEEEQTPTSATEVIGPQQCAQRPVRGHRLPARYRD